ncbi:DUF4178 domain-containing protein [Deefgea tanakiae]|uniref:DUF4178 domain-containing protein n=1 Tax=Deefgea tanakiae TaxID=2865840 RepID=A0ABX8Z8S1_9NEIS|nr:DUF4178 domain-containing protein [Deefgea tanakiae]QZA78981.1 DUF4178 domain-containing protein [Deefgea tanakiae]
MFRSACPSCGAEVLFRSTISAVAICEYCQSTVLRSADEVKDFGKIGKVLEDYSPIQIGTSGVFAGRAFTVLGRIQLRYEAGLWNEWYVSFDDGQQGWLADTSGQFMFTLPLSETTAATSSPAFDAFTPEMRYEHGGRVYVVTDVRTAQCIGGQGELPFALGQGYEAKVVDCRSADRFLTVDFSDVTLFKPNPTLYIGEAVELKNLQLQLLRDAETILASAGRLKGTGAVLDCPSCGSPLKYQAGVATQIVCKACASVVDCSGDKALVLEKHTAAAQYHATLDVGDSAAIDGVNWKIIGLIEMEETNDADSSWTEYLLYNAQQGFFWLVESNDGWYQVEVLNRLPDSWTNESAVLDGVRYRRPFELYSAKVTYAAGAFNWRVSVGDQVSCAEYEHNGERLCKEKSQTEVIWSKSKRIPNQLVEQWFGKGKIITPISNSGVDSASNRHLSMLFIVGLLVLNIPLAFAGSNLIGSLFWTGLAVWLIRLPLKSGEDEE